MGPFAIHVRMYNMYSYDVFSVFIHVYIIYIYIYIYMYIYIHIYIAILLDMYVCMYCIDAAAQDQWWPRWRPHLSS